LTFDFELHGLKFTATGSPVTDGGLAEIFLTNHKAGSTVGIMAADAADAAIAASLALQFGCPLETLRRALCRDGRGSASSRLAPRSTPWPPTRGRHERRAR
jgi:hypothetical protein